MNGPVESVLVHLFKVPVGPPQAPAGTYERVDVMRASPKFLRYRLLGVGCGALVLAFVALGVVIAALASQEPAVLLLLFVVMLAGVPLLVIGYVAVRIDFDLRYYVLTDRSMRVREGAWVVDEKTLTYANVQNVRVTQGPIQRLFGISDVRVDTAGGGIAPGKHPGLGAGHNVVIAGIEDASAVRDGILAHLKTRTRDAGLGDLDDERRRRTGFTPEHVATLREVASSAKALCDAAQRRNASA